MNDFWFYKIDILACHIFPRNPEFVHHFREKKTPFAEMTIGNQPVISAALKYSSCRFTCIYGVVMLTSAPNIPDAKWVVKLQDCNSSIMEFFFFVVTITGHISSVRVMSNSVLVNVVNIWLWHQFVTTTITRLNDAEAMFVAFCPRCKKKLTTYWLPILLAEKLPTMYMSKRAYA